MCLKDKYCLFKLKIDLLEVQVVQVTCTFVSSGKGIGYVLQELFKESLGMRQDVAHVLVLITDGRAQDDVMPPSRIAHALGEFQQSL